MSKKRLAITILACTLLMVATGAYANQPDGCAPLGLVNLGPGPLYYFTANGSPNQDLCWGKTGTVSYNNGSTPDACAYYRPRWQFGAGNSTLYQTMVVPSGLHVQNLTFDLIIDGIDPSHNGDNNALIADVYDTTTGAWLGGTFWSGYYGDYTCARPSNYPWSSVDLAGHTLKVIFTVRKDSTATINVKMISLFASDPGLIQ